MSRNKSKPFHVLSPVEGKDGQTFWVRLGTAFRNRDDSLNIYLNALPVNGKLQVRPADEQSKGD